MARGPIYTLELINTQNSKGMRLEIDVSRVRFLLNTADRTVLLLGFLQSRRGSVTIAQVKLAFPEAAHIFRRCCSLSHKVVSNSENQTKRCRLGAGIVLLSRPAVLSAIVFQYRRLFSFFRFSKPMNSPLKEANGLQT